MTVKFYMLKEQVLPKALVVFEVPRRLKGKGDQVLVIPYGKGGIANATPQLMSRAALEASYDALPEDYRNLSNLVERNGVLPGKGKRRRGPTKNVTDKAPEVLQLRKEGLSYSKIGEKVGMAISTVHNIVTKSHARPDMTGGGRMRQPIHSRNLRPKLKPMLRQPERVAISSVDDLTEKRARWLSACIARQNAPLLDIIVSAGFDMSSDTAKTVGSKYLQQLMAGGLIERRLRLTKTADGKNREVQHYSPTHRGNTVWSDWVQKKREEASPRNGSEAVDQRDQHAQ